MRLPRVCSLDPDPIGRNQTRHSQKHHHLKNVFRCGSNQVTDSDLVLDSDENQCFAKSIDMQKNMCLLITRNQCETMFKSGSRTRDKPTNVSHKKTPSKQKNPIAMLRKTQQLQTKPKSASMLVDQPK